MNGIDDVVIQAIVSYLTTECLTNVSDSSKSGLVRQGPLQQDPEAVENGISILVYVNDPYEPGDWPHVRDDLKEIAPGFSQYWLRRYSVQVLCQFSRLGYNDITAERVASEAISRVQKSLVSVGSSVNGLSDSFSERVYDPCYGVSKVTINKNGGPPNEYIWEAIFYLEIKTFQTA